MAQQHHYAEIIIRRAARLWVGVKYKADDSPWLAFNLYQQPVFDLATRIGVVFDLKIYPVAASSNNDALPTFQNKHGMFGILAPGQSFERARQIRCRLVCRDVTNEYRVA